MLIAKHIPYIAIAIVLVAFINGCSNEEAASTPALTTTLEVNDENCQLENVKKIENKQAREEFAGLCIRRGSFVASPKKSW